MVTIISSFFFGLTFGAALVSFGAVYIIEISFFTRLLTYRAIFHLIYGFFILTPIGESFFVSKPFLLFCLFLLVLFGRRFVHNTVIVIIIFCEVFANFFFTFLHNLNKHFVLFR